MSNRANEALSLALGAGGGLLIWYLTRSAAAGRAAGEKNGASHVPPFATVAPPPRVARPCVLTLDASGLTADGQKVDVAGAVEHCKAAGRADLVYAADGPASIYVDLTMALSRAGVPVTARRP